MTPPSTRRRVLLTTAMAAGLVSALVVPAAEAAAGADAAAPAARLLARAVLPAEATAAGPWDAAPDLEPDLSAPGGRQPIGGFSALLADSQGRWWAMPDNGFGAKTNSRSFLLRVYQVEPAFETARGGPGRVHIRGVVQLSDPHHRIPWAIVTEGTQQRLLTGGDFDLESARIAPDGTWWFGEEFGPFLLHTDARGRLLEAPIPTPAVSSPDNPLLPPGAEPNLGRSSGFEGMALSADGRYLYPTLEGPLSTQDPMQRTMLQYDVRNRSWTGRTYVYPMSRPDTLVSDVTALDAHRLLVLERDNGEGVEARWKRAFVVDLRNADPTTGRLPKREVLDLLRIADPAGISLPRRPGDVGLGTSFSFPYVTVEAVLPLSDDRLAVVNDTNFGSTGRNPDLPDYSDLIVVKVPGLPG